MLITFTIQWTRASTVSQWHRQPWVI